MIRSWDEWEEILAALPHDCQWGARQPSYTPLYCHIIDYTWMYDGSVPDRLIDVPLSRRQMRMMMPVLTDLRKQHKANADRRRFREREYEPREPILLLIETTWLKQNLKRYRVHRRRFKLKAS